MKSSEGLLMSIQERPVVSWLGSLLVTIQPEKVTTRTSQCVLRGGTQVYPQHLQGRSE